MARRVVHGGALGAATFRYGRLAGVSFDSWTFEVEQVFLMQVPRHPGHSQPALGRRLGRRCICPRLGIAVCATTVLIPSLLVPAAAAVAAAAAAAAATAAATVVVVVVS